MKGSALRRNVASGTHYGIGMSCLTEAGEQQIDGVHKKDWTNVESHAIYFNSQATIDSGDAKNMADKSTKITIFIMWKAL